VVILEGGAQALEDLDGVLDRGLVHVDLLEPAQQRAVLFEVVAEFLVGGRADAADRAARQGGLEQVRGVHRPATGCARADHGVDLVNEQHRVRHRLKLGDDLLQPFLEIAAIARAGQQRAHVERIDHRFGQHFGHIPFDDLARQTFGNRRLADARIADIERVVLGTAAQDLDRPVHLRPATDQRIDLAAFRLGVEVDGELVERRFLLVAALLLGLRRFFLLVGALRGLAFDLAAALADAVADIAHRIQTAHVLLLEEVDRVAIALGKQRDQHVGAGDGVLAGGLDVQDRALDHPLEARCRLRIGAVFRFK